jgi:hypothetical protein
MKDGPPLNPTANEIRWRPAREHAAPRYEWYTGAVVLHTPLFPGRRLNMGR